MKRYVTMNVDPSYLWDSPLDKKILNLAIRAVSFANYLCKKGLSKEHRPLCLFLTDKQSEQGKPHIYGPFIYIDVKKLNDIPKNQIIAEIIRQIKSGLIKASSMGYDWDEKDVMEWFYPAEQCHFQYREIITSYHKNPYGKEKARIVQYTDATILAETMKLNQSYIFAIEVFYNKNDITTADLHETFRFFDKKTITEFTWIDNENILVTFANKYTFKYNLESRNVTKLSQQ